MKCRYMTELEIKRIIINNNHKFILTNKNIIVFVIKVKFFHSTEINLQFHKVGEILIK